MIENRQVMAKNIRRLMFEKDVTARQVCEALGFKKTTFNDWTNGRSYPRIDKIEMMANYFDVKKSDLVEEPIHFSMSDEQFNAEQLYKAYKKAPVSIQEAVCKLLEMEVL